jgi:hypothetical protein
VTFLFARIAKQKFYNYVFPKHDLQNHFIKAFPLLFQKLSLLSLSFGKLCCRPPVVLAYNSNPKPTFSKTLLKKKQFEKSFISNKRCFGFQKSLLKNPALFYQKVSKLKALRNKLLSWSKKMAFKKMEFLKNFAPFNSWPISNILKTLHQIENALRKDASNPLFVFLKILRKVASSKWRFLKIDL